VEGLGWRVGCGGFGVEGWGLRVGCGGFGVEGARARCSRCRANMAHVRQSRPDSGLVFQANALTTFQVVPSSLDRTSWKTCLHERRRTGVVHSEGDSCDSCGKEVSRCVEHGGRLER